jgi:hypothetical protein
MLSLDNAVAVEFPLRGEWVAIQTPAERVPSHGTELFGQRYAFDFVRLDRGSNLPYRRGLLWRHLAATAPVEAFLCWDAPVLSAFDGTVMGAMDGWPDALRLNLVRDHLRGMLRPPRPRGSDFRPLAGNYVLVEGAPGVALYAHLRQESLCVRQGQRVGAGEPLGRVGNSGSSTMPHLHFHLMDGPDLLTAAGRLCAFRSYERWRGGAWEPVAGGVPALLEPIRVQPRPATDDHP